MWYDWGMVLTTKQTQELIKYWQLTAEHDYETMNFLFQGKRYSDSLFFGHIVLEKILKAHVVKATKDNAPKIHNLIRLTEIAKLNLSDEEKDFFGLVNSFNLSSRYPDYKLSFYKHYNNRLAVEANLKQIKKMYKKLCQMI
jgi:HEPN domain-containing protein